MSRPQSFSSGCTTLDNALGGGWAVGHMANIYGLESSGKTLLLIEAAAQFARKFPKAPMRLVDAEAAFDEDYAASIGYPIGRVSMAHPGEVQTIEDWYEDLVKFTEKVPKGEPALYMEDSLDALSSDAEMARDIRSTGYKTEKMQALSQMFRRVIALLESRHVSLMVISQMRMNPAAKPGTSPYIETGGTAFKYYAYQRLKLSKKKSITRTIAGETREIGIKVEGNVKKNKFGAPFRKADFPIIFGFGIDNMASNLEYLSTHFTKVPKGKEKEYPEKDYPKGIPFLARIPGSTDVKTLDAFVKRLQKLDSKDFKEMAALINQTVIDCDTEISEGFRPTKSRDEGGFEAADEIDTEARHDQIDTED